MCTYAFAIEESTAFPLLIVGNRDEFLDRPTQSLTWWEPMVEFWPKGKKVYAGKDLKSGGTWLASDEKKRWALVTNVRKLGLEKPDGPSRGYLPLKWIAHNGTLDEFLSKIELEKHLYSPFNLLFGDGKEVHFLGSFDAPRCHLPKGVYGISNASLNTPWPKLEAAKGHLEQALRESQSSNEQLFKAFQDKRTYPDDRLPSTGVPIEAERMLSALCVASENYGTRCQSVIRFSEHGELCTTESVLKQ